MTVAARLVLDRRRSLLWWSIAVVGLVLFTVSLYPSIEGDESFDDLAQDLPDALRSLIGIDEAIPLTSAPGYLHGRLFSTLLPVLLLIFGIGLGARAIAGSEQDGTLELLLANPVTRVRVAAERYVGSMGLLAGLSAVFAVALSLLAVPFGALDDVSPAGLAGASVGVFGISLLHGTIAFTAGALTGRRATAIGAATTIAVAGYLVHGLLGVSDVLRPVRFVTPWHWYLGRNMLAEGVAPDAIAVPVLLSAVLFAAGVAGFARRDLR